MIDSIYKSRFVFFGFYIMFVVVFLFQFALISRCVVCNTLSVKRDAMDGFLQLNVTDRAEPV